jgi:hypothetical protein
MASHGRDTDDDGAQRSKESTVMGRKREKLSVQRGYVRDSNKEKHRKKLRSILGVLPCSILRIWRLWARTKNEYTMDHFSVLTIREPWLLKRISTSNASTWLAGGDLIYKVFEVHGKGPIRQRFPKRPLRRKRKGTKTVPKFSCTKDDFMWELRNNLAHTFTYFENLGFSQLIIFKVWKIPRLMRWTCLCGIVLMMHIRMTRLPVWWVNDCERNQRQREKFSWRVAFFQLRYLARS